jgi:excisionase family DNA binding protein
MNKIRKLGLTTSEAARHLGVSLSTIRRWSDLGHLRGYRTPGGQRRFSIEQLDDFLVSLESGGPRRTPAPPTGESEPRFTADEPEQVEEPRFTASEPVEDTPEPPDAA